MREQKPRYDFDVFDLRQPRPDVPHRHRPRCAPAASAASSGRSTSPARSRAVRPSPRRSSRSTSVQDMLRRYPDVFEAARTAADVERIARAGRVASMMGMEGGHSIEGSLGALRQFARMGVGYMTLTHNVDAAVGRRRRPTSPGHGGLIAVRRGSGARDEPAGDARRPVPRVAGHHARRAARHRGAGDLLALVGAGDLRRAAQRARRRPGRGAEERRRRDGDLRARLHRARGRAPLPEARGRERPAEGPAAVHAGRGHRRHGGVGQGEPGPEGDARRRSPITSTTSARSPASITSGSAATSTASPSVIAGLEDVSTYPALFAELLRRGYSEDDVQKIAGRNVLRVMRAAEGVAQRLQKARGPSKATIEALDGGMKK